MSPEEINQIMLDYGLDPDNELAGVSVDEDYISVVIDCKAIKSYCVTQYNAIDAVEWAEKKAQHINKSFKERLIKVIEHMALQSTHSSPEGDSQQTNNENSK